MDSLLRLDNMGVSQNYGYLLWGPHNKDYSILGSILGSPYLGKLPYCPKNLRRAPRKEHAKADNLRLGKFHLCLRTCMGTHMFISRLLSHGSRSGPCIQRTSGFRVLQAGT